MKQSKKRSRQGSFSSVSSSPTITTPIDEYIMPNLALLQNENDLQEQPYDPKPKTSCRSPKETFTRDTKSNFGNVPEVKGAY
jgi:hypothetical protein